MKMKLIRSLVAFCLMGSPIVPRTPDAPDNTFKKAQGRMYCEANPRQPACHSTGTLTITLDPGYTIDRSYHQGAIPCCGGEENHNGKSTEIPAGVYMEFAGGHDGEWGVFKVKLVADSNNIDENGVVKAWTITGDVYCGPSGAPGKGGCNANAYGWIKQKRIN
jgi:hypothetical protein